MTSSISYTVYEPNNLASICSHRRIRLQGICSWSLILESNPPTSLSKTRTSGRPMTHVDPLPLGSLTQIDSGCSGDRTTPMLPRLQHGVFQ